MMNLIKEAAIKVEVKKLLKAGYFSTLGFPNQMGV